MASLFKQKVVRYVDENGKRVSKATPGAKRKAERSRKWYGEYIDENRMTRRVPLSTDKAASQAQLNELVKQAERRKAGLTNPYDDHLLTPIANHIEDYRQFLIAKDNTSEHVKLTISRIERLVKGCEFRTISDIEGTKVAVWLSDRRKSAKRFSAQTSNFYLDGFKYFCNWLVRSERLPRNPVNQINRVRIETDRRHDRRSLSEDEFARLISAAATGESVEGVEGPDRAMLYVLATWTGLRRRELSSLTRESFDLNAETPVVTVVAGYSKH